MQRKKVVQKNLIEAIKQHGKMIQINQKGQNSPDHLPSTTFLKADTQFRTWSVPASNNVEMSFSAAPTEPFDMTVVGHDWVGKGIDYPGSEPRSSSLQARDAATFLAVYWSPLQIRMERQTANDWRTPDDKQHGRHRREKRQQHPARSTQSSQRWIVRN